MAEACSILGCGRNPAHRGWCNAHYIRWQRYGDPLGRPALKAKTDRLCSVDGCAKKHQAQGYCWAHYHRWRHHGDPLEGRSRCGDAESYFKDVLLTYEGDDCLIWPYYFSGRQSRFKSGGKSHSVTRLACADLNGPPPTPKHEAAHSCGKGHLACVTKRHLSWKTTKENQADRLVHDTHIRGERAYNSKLTESDVRQILALQGEISERKIGALFGVSGSAINSIFHGKTWGWLTALMQARDDYQRAAERAA